MPSKPKTIVPQDPLIVVQQKLKAFALLYEKMQKDFDEETCDAILQARQHFVASLNTCLTSPHTIENTLHAYHHDQKYIGVRIAPEKTDALHYYDGKDEVALYFILGFAVASVIATAAIGVIGFISASPFIGVFALGFLCGLSYNLLCTGSKMEAIRKEEKNLFRMFRQPKANMAISSDVINTIKATLAEPFQPEQIVLV